MNLETPHWISAEPETQPSFQESWQLHLTDTTGARALWLRFDILVSGNGFKRIAETWATYFHRAPGAAEVKKLAVRQTYDLREFGFNDESGILQIGTSSLGWQSTRGLIRAKGHSIDWDLSIVPRSELHYDLVPSTLKRARLVRNAIETPQADLIFNGTCHIDGEEVVWREAPGLRSHQSGPRTGQRWAWAHCNQFRDENGQEVPFVFEGMSARTQMLGGIARPRLNAFVFHYKGETFEFNSISDFLRIHSQPQLNSWVFKANKGELSFRGEVKAEHKTFVGRTFEDTDGSLLYVASAAFADLKIHVYRRGKLEATLLAPAGAAFEVADRERNPYVPLLI